MRYPASEKLEIIRLVEQSPPPRNIKQPLLERAISWHLQAKMFGGLSAKTKRELDALRREGGSRRSVEGRGGGSTDASTSEPTRSSARPLAPGTRLVREWRGRTHLVDVTVGGFRWNGGEHRSLSAIARKITGARRSGPRFFGL